MLSGLTAPENFAFPVSFNNPILLSLFLSNVITGVTDGAGLSSTKTAVLNTSLQVALCYCAGYGAMEMLPSLLTSSASPFLSDKLKLMASAANTASSMGWSRALFWQVPAAVLVSKGVEQLTEGALNRLSPSTPKYGAYSV